ncbi:LacI family DNA-binding transcriptional regulator [Microbacterium suaedae]|uniref:LacI family DNA-binding transcriptional regulator n=1 Tax=Microbacterium suaedae TaxID=2067813 RepID=UPI000DA11836|nr:LacI family DNA-binding transcriptional regulator [Microbacterium suaedae]
MTSTSRVTLAAVAAHAGVSIATASRALRGRGEMRADTRARVARSATELGYSAGGEARGRPRRGTALQIDLVLDHFHSSYSEEIVAGARTAAADLGYDLTLTAERDEPADDWPERIRSRGSAGVILGLIVPTREQVLAMERAGIPLVVVDPPAESVSPLPSVRTTDRAGGEAAARHLVERGARRFIVIDGSPPFRFGRARVEGFTRALADLAPDAACIHTSAAWSARDARIACGTALDEHDDGGPVGVFACSDEMAVGAYGAAHDTGRRIPDDMLVVGFDDVRGARWVQPPLTTIRQPIREMAAAAVRILARASAGAEVADETVVLPTELVERGSTRRGSPATVFAVHPSPAPEQ